MQQRGAETNSDGFDTRNTVDPVHEVVQVYQPNDAQYRDTCEKLGRVGCAHDWRCTTEPVQSPCRGQEVSQEAPAGAYMPMVVQEPDQCDQATPAADCRKELRWHEVRAVQNRDAAKVG